MAHTTPRVEDGGLHLPDQDHTTQSAIPLGSEQWYAWLELHYTFRVKSGAITYTARTEQRAGKWYWYAYRRSAGKLRIAYLGKSSELTAERLTNAAYIFALPPAPLPQAQDLSSKRPAVPKRGDPVSFNSPKYLADSSTPALLAVRGNLPTQLTSFVGRTREITEAIQLLARCRLLTLTGTGGIGKTRLALQIASLLPERFPGGLWFTGLAGISSPADLLPSLVLTLGIQPKTEQDMLAALQIALQSEPTLLILDNCEHLLDACAPLVEQLLSACPTLHVLATSREMLCIPGETILQVTPLSLPGPATPLNPSQVCQSEAVQLLIERILPVQPSFTLTEQNTPVLVRVCQQLEGIPLALELAAARLSLMPIEQIAERLDREPGARFHLLSAGKRTAAARHRTLRAAIDWSYQLLSLPEQKLLRRLSFFRGGWTLEAAEAICVNNDLAAREIFDLLGKLVHKSLVVMGEETLPPRDGEQTVVYRRARYHLLETIRQYSQEKLQAAGEEQELQRQHLAYFLQLTEQADMHLRGPQQLYWLRCLDPEHDNLQVALSTAKQFDLDAALSLTSSLAVYWMMRSQFPQGRKELEEVLVLSAERADALKARCLYRASLLIFFQGDIPRSLQLAEICLPLFQASGDQQGIGQALSIQVEAARKVNNYQQALTLGKECEALLTASGDDWTLAITYFSRATIHMHEGNYAETLSLLEESLRLMQKQGDRWGLALAHNCLGRLHSHLGNYAKSITCLEESVRLARELGDSNMVAAGNHILAMAFAKRKDYTGAHQQLTEVRKQYERSGNLGALAELLFDQGQVAILQSDLAQAAHYLESSATFYTERGNHVGRTLACYHLGRVAVMQGDIPRALHLLRESVSIFHQNNQHIFLAGCLEVLAALSILLHAPRQGARWLGHAQSLHALTPPQRTMLPANNAFYERTVTTIQALLSKEDFAAEFAKGQALSLEYVIHEIQTLYIPQESASDSPPLDNKPAPLSPSDLTSREIEVLRLLATGMSNHEIAQSLNISPGTVRAHLSTIYSKLAVHSRTAAVHAARTAHLI